MSITLELAEILGLLCAEGCHVVSFSSYWGLERGKPRYYRNAKSESIQFYNKDRLLISHYQKLLSKEFDYHPKLTKHGKINICKINIMREITRHTKLGHLSWQVPGSIRNSNKEIKIAFLRGYFDGDGSATGRKIRFFSCNKSGLLQVSRLLDDLNFKHTFQGPIIKEDRKPSYIIQISRQQKERFLNIIKPISKIPG